MDYTIINDDSELFYYVTFDEEKLKVILEKLKNYSYNYFGEGLVGGLPFTKWPATSNLLKNRIEKHALIGKEKVMVYPESINYNKYSDTLSFKYSYKKLPDLYDYIDIILNNRDIREYMHLFSNVNGKYDVLYVVMHRNQLLRDSFFNYANSRELSNHMSVNNSKEYDYKGLNELYKETLESIYFKLIAVKEYLNDSEFINVLNIL